MIAVVSDTHRQEGHGLTGRTLEAVREATVVVHAGDFTTGPVLDAFRDVSHRLEAVHGNNDDAVVCRVLPARRTFEAEGLSVTVVHGHEHGDTALSMLGREEEADVVVSGHSHRPGVVDTGDVTLLNPGSHAQPRGFRPAHAELDDGRGRLIEPDGTLIEAFEV